MRIFKDLTMRGECLYATRWQLDFLYYIIYLQALQAFYAIYYAAIAVSDMSSEMAEITCSTSVFTAWEG